MRRRRLRAGKRARGARGQARDLRRARRAPRREDCVLASSTSAIVASKFTEAPRRPRALPRRASGQSTAPRAGGRAVRRAVDLAHDQARAHDVMRSVGQVPIDVKREIDGFVLNRLQVALLTEAFRLVQDGVVSPQDLDHTIADGLGLRWAFMGPFETIELNAPGGIADYCQRYVPWFRRYVADLPRGVRVGRRAVAEGRRRLGPRAPRRAADRARRACGATSASRRWPRTSATAEARRHECSRSSKEQTQWPAAHPKRRKVMITCAVTGAIHTPIDVAAPADHRRRDRRRRDRRARGRRRGRAPARARPEGRPPRPASRGVRAVPQARSSRRATW